MTMQPDEAVRKSDSQLAVRAASWSIVMQWGLRLVQLTTFLILARLLEPSDFGLFALAAGLIAVVDGAASLGLTEAIAQHRDVSAEQLRAAHRTAIVVGIFAAGVVAAVGIVIGSAVDSPLPLLVSVLAPSVGLRALRTVPEAVMRRELDFRQIAIGHLAGSGMGAASALGVATVRGGAAALVIQVLVGAAITTGWIRLMSDWKPQPPSCHRAASELLRTGWKIAASGLLNIVNRRSDDLLLGIHHPVARVGLYSTGYAISELAESGLSGALGQVALPAFATVEHSPVFVA